MFRHKCTQLFRYGKMVKTRCPQERDSLEKVRRTIDYSLEKMRAYTSLRSIRRYKSRLYDVLPQHPNINLGKTDKNTRNGLGKTDSCCGGMAFQLSANLAKIWISESIVASLPPQLIGNYKTIMQPIRLIHKSLLPERLSGRTDVLYIGLMIL